METHSKEKSLVEPKIDNCFMCPVRRKDIYCHEAFSLPSYVYNEIKLLKFIFIYIISSQREYHSLVVSSLDDETLCSFLLL